MAYVIGAACIDVMDRSCMEECPVDCIYEGDRKLYIHPDECIDCGACELACPTEAIVSDRQADAVHKQDNRQFFQITLPGRAEPLGSPGGSRKIGVVGVDTPPVSSV
ncbi:ferredoxin [Embleya scabrispora]|uniref:ferredoxin n=1 Tax=Embleya scabrispora TaxID=159449 RepID=UPI0004758C81|nr:ferredoxin [Embleya scabrispora]MYS85135.1 (4Fe-4S)-binding protein [Streptomyces sp. SID5474]